MTVLPFIDIKATPIYSVESPQASKLQLLPRLSDIKGSSRASHLSNKLPATPTTCCSGQRKCARTPKIKILPRTDEILKKLPREKSDGASKHTTIWKPLTRELPDYDYLWEPLQREDIRHQYDSYAAPDRITASRPDEPFKMTTMFETGDRHYHNYRRVRAMQQRQWNKEHIQYTIYPYAQMIERETYNRDIRKTLKDQMKDKDELNKYEQQMKSIECRILIQRDQNELEQEKHKLKQRAKSLSKVTAKNKELMENKWEYDQWSRAHQWHVDRAILADDPINWSKTMT